MHIGFITPEYPHPKTNNAGGLGTSIKNLVTELVQKKILVSVFIYGQNKDLIFKENGITFYLIKRKKYQILGWYLHRKYIQNFITKIVDKEQIDLLEAPDWTGITAFMRFKTPLVIRFHGSDAYFCKLDKRNQKFKNFLFEKLALKSADAFIAPTKYAGEETQKIFNLDSSKIRTIHYGLHLKDFVNDTPEKFNRFTILYIGTVIRKKGVFELAKIFNNVIETIPDAKLIIIGGDAPDIKTGSASTYSLVDTLFSSKARKHVAYMGKIPYSEVQEQIKRAQVCVFPSFAETLGMVTIESMALKRPVVNTSIGWAQDLIDDGINGFLIHPNEIERYAEKIKTLLLNNELCLKVGGAARIKVEESFDISKIANTNIEYYSSIINK